MLTRWKLILGEKADESNDVQLTESQQGMSDVLDALYDSERDRGLGDSAPSVNRWLGDIRTYFPSSVVQLMQRDALERLGLDEMLLEPELLETIEADVHLVATLLNLKEALPNKTRETAREVVRKVVEELEKKLRNPLLEAINGSLNRAVRNRNPRLNEIDWHQTIRANLRHYQPEYKSIIPERLIGHGKKRQQLKHLILLIDQSGSMASSMVYAGVIGSILASMRSLKTHLVVFDTTVVDLTEKLHDPVDLLFATQLGGGTHIDRALKYGRQLITRPEDTIMILLSDLMEGGPEAALLSTVQHIKSMGVQLIALLSLSDQGKPAYDTRMSARFTALDVPNFACTPDRFPDLMAAAFKGEDLHRWGK